MSIDHEGATVPSDYPPPPAEATQDRVKPFAGVPTSDYVTDVVALALLALSLAMPWTVHDGTLQSAADVAWVLPITLLSLLSLTLPYLARFGVLPASWTVHSTRRARLLANLPYALVVLVHLVLDATGFGGYQGLGSAAALGLAGAVLAATPRRSELGPVEADQEATATWWRLTVGLGVLVALVMLVWLVLFVVGYFTLSDGAARAFGGGKAFALVLVEVLVIGALVLVPIVRTLAGRSGAWRNVAVALGVVLAVVLFLGSDASSDLTALELINSFPDALGVVLTGSGLLLFPAFAAAAASPAASRALRPEHPVSTWVGTARAALVYSALVALALVLVAVVAIVDGAELAGAVTGAVILLVLTVVAILANGALARNLVEGRRVALASAVVVLLLGIAALVAGSVDTRLFWLASDGALTWAHLLLAVALPAVVIGALTLPAPVREYYAQNRPAQLLGAREEAYTWRPRPAAPVATPPAGHPAQAGPEGQPQQPYDQSAFGQQPYGAPGQQPETQAGYGQAPAQPRVAGHVHTEPGEASGVTAPVEAPEPVHEAPAAAPEPAHEVPAENQTEVLPPVDGPAPGADLHGFTAEVAADPSTEPAVLAQIVQDVPGLRRYVAGNPSTYPALLEWLAQLGDPDVDAALAARER